MVNIDSIVFEKVILIENLICWVNQSHFPKKTVGVGVLKLSLDQVFLIEQEEYKGFLYIYYQKKTSCVYAVPVEMIPMAKFFCFLQ